MRGAAFAIWLASWTNQSLLASGSYTVPFLIVSRTIGVFFVEKVADYSGRQIMPYLPN